MTVVNFLAKYLTKEGVEVHVAAREVGDVGEGVPRYVKLLRLTPRTFAEEARKYDIIHIHTTYPYLEAALKGKLMNLVFTYHGYCPWRLVPGLRNKLVHLGLRFAYRKLLPSVPRVTAISNFVKEQLRKLFNVNAKTIYNGVDLDVFKPMDVKERDGYPILFNAMAYERLKGLDIALMYFRSIKDYFHDAKIILRGISNEVISHIERMRLRLKLSKRDIILLPYIPQEKLAYYYNLSDVYFLTSRWESFGLPIIESFSCGTPVLALNVNDARREHIMNSGAGELFSDESELIFSLDKILRNRYVYRDKALKYAKSLSWENIARQYIELYEELLAS